MATFPKTLIIGLGGLGSDVVVDIYKRFNSHASHEEDKKKVRFLALDTDSNEIAERRLIMKPEDVIQTSSTSNITVGHFLDDVKSYSTVENWFPTESPELTQLSINDGSGQIRVVSRLALSHAIQTGKLDRLEKVINELLSLSAGEGNIIDVHIVTSLAGGTGAGSFIQMAYYVREILKRNNINNPKVWGYFMLGDIFLRDPSINLSDPSKTTNILANTYACIKELNGLYEVSGDTQIEFDYGLLSNNPKVVTKDNSIPFSHVFLYDFENNDGNNLKNIRNYKGQMTEFIYLNAFSPTGSETRSRTINEIFKQIENGVASRFGSTGISKVIYPVDNLLQYFSVKRLSDNLRDTWLRIDNDFDKLFEEWRLDANKGIIKKEPVLSEFFMNNVETIARNSMGAEQAIFKRIWQSTQVVDQESLQVTGPKTDYLLREMENYLTALRDNNQDISALMKINHNSSFLGKENDSANDRTNIKQVEDQLEALQREVFDFIDDNKSLALEELFIKDATSMGYYTENAKHRINYYLLEKGKALHPLAQRYFFYDLLHKLEDNVAVLNEQNTKTLASITAYKVAYDIKDDRGEDTHIESALEAYDIYRSADKSLLKAFSKITGKSTELEDFKNEYVSKSKRQAQNLQKFALEKLEEFVFEGLVLQVKKIISNLELLFNGIPHVLVGLKNTQNALEAVTNDAIGDPSKIFILSKDKHREHIYNEVIAKQDTIYFPEDISRNIYEELYSKTFKEINNPISYAQDRIEEKINTIFTELVVKKQKEQLAKDFENDFAGYNIIQAMRKHAELEGENPVDFMNRKCREAETRATPFGAKYTNTASRINSWAIHPECLDYQYLTPDDADALFNNPGNQQNNANRIVADYFEKTEIIREDSVMVLSVPRDYPKFAPVDTSKDYSTSLEGVYYTYYKKRIKEVQNDPNLPSPHLDRRWTNPRYFRDLGVNLDQYEKTILRAFIYGLANRDIVLIDNHGTKTWGYNTDRGITYLVDNQGKSIRSNVQKLLLEALWNDERMIDILSSSLTRDIENSKEIWTQIRMEGSSITNIPLLKRIRDFKFEGAQQYSDLNVLTLFNGYVSNVPSDSRFVSIILEIILEMIIEITGNKGESTKEQVNLIINKMIEDAREEGLPIVKSNLAKLFENQLNKFFG